MNKTDPRRDGFNNGVLGHEKYNPYNNLRQPVLYNLYELGFQAGLIAFKKGLLKGGW